MREKIFARIMSMFDAPEMQNNLRGLWVEAMVCELLGDGWIYTGNDWSAWDLEREDGLRVEIKQSAMYQSWGPSISPPRFSIATPKGYYPDGETYVANDTGSRMAHIYIFAWHDRADQRIVSEWNFYVVETSRLPEGQKSISLNALTKLVAPVSATELRNRLENARR
ncbi:hypothetical protein [Salipiger mucosus]|uniref:hypothetical protein n=1 Tax=Salipiger mucosus TaxID=263378 RepID=UPI00037A90C1|nr:hypothetical protein [Salipiger mucosus]